MRSGKLKLRGRKSYRSIDWCAWCSNPRPPGAYICARCTQERANAATRAKEQGQCESK